MYRSVRLFHFSKRIEIIRAFQLVNSPQSNSFQDHSKGQLAIRGSQLGYCAAAVLISA